MPELELHELSVFEQGILVTLSALVGSLKAQGAINASDLESIHALLKSCPTAQVKNPADRSKWEWAISPLIAKIEQK